jgi:hypothetical protein
LILNFIRVISSGYCFHLFLGLKAVELHHVVNQNCVTKEIAFAVVQRDSQRDFLAHMTVPSGGQILTFDKA